MFRKKWQAGRDCPDLDCLDWARVRATCLEKLSGLTLCLRHSVSVCELLVSLVLCEVWVYRPRLYGGRNSGLQFITTFRGSLGPPHHAHRGSFWYYKGSHCFPWNKHLHMWRLTFPFNITNNTCHLKMHHFNKKKHGKLDQTCFIYRQILRHLPNIAYWAWSKNCSYSSLAWW